MLTKADQLKKNKVKKDLSESEKVKYFTWIKENKSCIICGEFPEIHHVTNKTIRGTRRLNSRVVPLCFNHHSAQSPILSIHNNTYKFYDLISLDELLTIANEYYEEFLSLE